MTAISSFYVDTGVWPARLGATDNHFNVLRSGPTNYTTTDPDFVDDSGVKPTWDNMTTVDHLENHLVVDNPGGTLGATTPSGDYRDGAGTGPKADWKGPYIERMRRTDPWGRNYLVYVEGMHTGHALKAGWVLSAGPNLRVDTKTSDAAPQGDDIGVILYRKRPSNYN